MEDTRGVAIVIPLWQSVVYSGRCCSSGILDSNSATSNNKKVRVVRGNYAFDLFCFVPRNIV